MPVLLEHRAEPRRDLHAAGEHAPRPVARHRVPLPRAELLRLGRRCKLLPNDRQPAALALCAARRPRGQPAATTATCSCACCASPTTTTGRTSRASVKSLTPRLLQTDLLLTRPFGDWSTYARTLRWQVLQTADPTTPHRPALRPRAADRRALRRRLGAAASTSAFETEFNRFAESRRPLSRAAPDRRARCTRSAASRRPFVLAGLDAHAQGLVQRRGYSLDQPLADGSTQRVARDPDLQPRQRLDARARHELRSAARVRQTLEPRLFYVNTPYRDQDDLPNFDSAAKDFNFDSIFTENAFSGVDRVSDSHQLDRRRDLARARPRDAAPRRCASASRSATAFATSASRPTACR